MATQEIAADESDKQESEFMLAEYSTLRELRLSLDSLGENRVNFYMAAISGSIVGLALINQLSTYPDIVYFIDGTIIVALFLFGLITFARMVERNVRIISYTRGMNRIRRYFADKHPNIQPYLWLPITDDVPSFNYKSINLQKRKLSLSGLTPMVGVINSIIATAGIVILTRVVLDASTTGALLAGMLAFMIMTFLQYRYLASRMSRAKTLAEVRFPPQSKDQNWAK